MYVTPFVISSSFSSFSRWWEKRSIESRFVCQLVTANGVSFCFHDCIGHLTDDDYQQALRSTDLFTSVIGP